MCDTVVPIMGSVLNGWTITTKTKKCVQRVDSTHLYRGNEVLPPSLYSHDVIFIGPRMQNLPMDRPQCVHGFQHVGSEVV